MPVWISDSDLDSEKKLELDFEAFPNFLNQADIKKLYALRKDIFEVWYKKLPESLHKNISPRMYFALMALQNGLEQRLDITSDEPYNATFLRDLKYEHGIPKLSDFCDGTSHATERAALGQ